ncbi:unnamed protein product, partial [Bubo scandiacus]
PQLTDTPTCINLYRDDPLRRAAPLPITVCRAPPPISHGSHKTGEMQPASYSEGMARWTNREKDREVEPDKTGTENKTEM